MKTKERKTPDYRYELKKVEKVDGILLRPRITEKENKGTDPIELNSICNKCNKKIETVSDEVLWRSIPYHPGKECPECSKEDDY
ncbi:hypothetical protein KKC45_03260 [Patescibacteria group bacterium]|nr:hypothetical protein [Patescibacteria group bacterium]